ncbi:hypothetical protein JCGZ_16185 [Jatropha curcas]|uniref:Uncharacterized protein n=1 Tax=Jatropha curcas TaxID=180498 RepID=A0A067KEE3_JATCU|nr:hypothetical protein JCGZ_16185 [Jatropha curcas]
MLKSRNFPFLLMRVLICKIHCSLICFCQPSTTLYKAGPLKLENSPHVSSSTVISVGTASSYDNVSNDSIGVKEESVNVDGEELQPQNCNKGGLKKSSLGSKEVQKKRVQWMDFLGKELVQIREFESRT